MVEAFVLGKISKMDKNGIDHVIQEIRDISGVKEVSLVYGKYDLVAKVVGNSLDSIKEVISETIRKIPEIEYTQTLISAQ